MLTDSSSYDTNTLLIIIYVCDALSILGGLFIILSQSFYRSLQCNFSSKLIFYVAITNFIASIGNIIRYQHSGFPDSDGLCTAQGIIKQFGSISYVLWIIIISYTMNYLTFRHSYPSSTELERIYPMMHLIVWTISLLLTCLPLITNSYQKIEGDWCWMNDYWRYVSFFIPSWCAIIYIIYIYFKTWTEIKKMHNKHALLLSSPIHNINNSFVNTGEETIYRYNTLQKLNYFPLILIICYFLFPTITLITDQLLDINNKSTPFIIVLLMYLFMSLPGFFNGILFIFLIIKNVPISTLMQLQERNNDNTIDNQLCHQLIILYNSVSGAKKALSLLPKFHKYTKLHYDMLEINNNNESLKEFATNLKKFENHVVVGIVGGDGSNEWACSLIDHALQLITLQTEQNVHVQYPVIVPFPVGTGNDFSRALGWNNIGLEPYKILKHISDIFYCYNISKRFSVVDRWNIKYLFDHIQKEEYKQEEKQLINYNNNNNSQTVEYLKETYEIPPPSNFLCYISFGYDAQISNEWEALRKQSPQKFNNQKYGIFVYQKLGVKKFFNQVEPINDWIKCEIDGKECRLPNKCRSLKVINLNSFADGVFFWGTRNSKKNELNDNKWKTPQLNDGLLEVVATKGPINGTKVRFNLCHARRLGQSANIKLRILKVPIYVQIDGEGFQIHKKCTLQITLNNQLPTLIGYTKPRGVDYKYQAMTDINQYKKKQIDGDRIRFMKNIQQNQYDLINTTK